MSKMYEKETRTGVRRGRIELVGHNSQGSQKHSQ